MVSCDMAERINFLASTLLLYIYLRKFDNISYKDNVYNPLQVFLTNFYVAFYLSCVIILNFGLAAKW